MITYLLPTRNRRARLKETLDRLAQLSEADHERLGGAEIVVVDDASSPAVARTDVAPNDGPPVRLIRRDEPAGAAARNDGAEAALGDWLVMLDDDSWPLDARGLANAIEDAPTDVAAVGARITLANGRHEAGGLPEVIVGCGAAVRREAFLGAGGYDRAFHYYAEEYDLCARLILDGWRIRHDARFRVHHAKVSAERDMNTILERLARNNGWVAARYAPAGELDAALDEIAARCEAIARCESALGGYERGREALERSIAGQPRREMTSAQWDRFTGAAAFRETWKRLGPAPDEPVAVVEPGKNEHIIRSVLGRVGATIIEEERAVHLVIGTLSPGPILDAIERRAGDPRVIAPWLPEHAPRYDRACAQIP